MFIAQPQAIVRVFVIGFVLSAALMSPPAAADPLTPGNLAVVRVGNGTDPLLSNSTAAATFIDEYTTTGTLVQTIALPDTATITGNRALTLSGTQVLEGHLTLSGDYNYLLLAGYNQSENVPGSHTATSASVNRVIGRLEISTGIIDTTTALQDVCSAQSVRSVYSTNGTDLWATGNGGGTVAIGTSSVTTSGVHYTVLGSTTSTQLNTMGLTANNRAIDVFNGQLYVSSGNTSIPNAPARGPDILNIAGGYPPTSPVIPTTGGNRQFSLPGFPTAAGPQPDDFWFEDANTLYVTDNRSYANDVGMSPSGGIQKWTFDGTTWQFQYTIGVGTNVSTAPFIFVGAHGLTGTIDGSGIPVLYVTTFDGAGAAQNKLVTITDYGNPASTAASVTTLAISPGIIGGEATTNTAFRGVELIQIPEPASALLLGAAALMCMARRRR